LKYVPEYAGSEISVEYLMRELNRISAALDLIAQDISALDTRLDQGMATLTDHETRITALEAVP